MDSFPNMSHRSTPPCHTPLPKPHLIPQPPQYVMDTLLYMHPVQTQSSPPFSWAREILISAVCHGAPPAYVPLRSSCLSGAI